MMFVPLLASVMATAGRGTWHHRLGSLLASKPQISRGRFIGYLAIALFGTLVVCALPLLPGWWFGLLHPATDAPGQFFQDVISKDPNLPAQVQEQVREIPQSGWWFMMVMQVVLGSVFNVLATVGEEAGWRGWLHTHLDSRLSWWRIPVVTGLIWGVWHTPVLLLGHNYPMVDWWWRVPIMTVFTVLLSFPLWWLREVTGSMWPAAVSHGAINAAAGLPVMLSSEGLGANMAQVSVLGWTGWLVLAPVAALTGRLGMKHRTARLLKAEQAPLNLGTCLTIVDVDPPKPAQ